MTAAMQSITIKGTKEGLHFRFRPDITFDSIVKELDQKLNQNGFLQGPLTHVHLHLGDLYLTPRQKEKLVKLIENSGSLLVKNIYSDVITMEEANERVRISVPRIEVNTIRSGEVIESDQDILVLGDLNPGGWIISRGNIYVMGALKGYAHAGVNGNDNAIIAAAVMEPMQLRIANHILTSFPDHEIEDKVMKFAYVDEDNITLAKIQTLAKVHPHFTDTFFKGLS